MASFLKKIIRNDAMREDPPDIYGWRVLALACTVSYVPFRRTRINMTDYLLLGVFRWYVVQSALTMYTRAHRPP